MTVLADTRTRELVKCMGCRMFSREWRTLVVQVEGAPFLSVKLCRRCESDTLDAIRYTWEGLRRG